MRGLAPIVCLILCGPHAAALTVEAALGAFALYERGDSTMALCAGERLELGLVAPLGGVALDLRVGAQSGAFVGECVGLDGMVGLRGVGPSWQPALGLAWDLDFGSRLVFSFSPDPVPERPLSYLGVRLEALAFASGSYRWSLLGATASLALCEGPPVYRLQLDLLRLSARIGDGGGADGEPATGRLYLSYGLQYSLLGFGLDGWRPLGAEAGIAWGPVEAAADFRELSDNPNHFGGCWAVSASLCLAPRLGAWNPAVGLGYLHANPDYLIDGRNMSQIRESGFDSWLLVVKPLRFLVPLGSGCSVLVSVAELRFGSIVPLGFVQAGVSGPLALAVDLFQIGLCLDV